MDYGPRIVVGCILLILTVTNRIHAVESISKYFNLNKFLIDRMCIQIHCMLCTNTYYLLKDFCMLRVIAMVQGHFFQ